MRLWLSSAPPVGGYDRSWPFLPEPGQILANSICRRTEQLADLRRVDCAYRSGSVRHKPECAQRKTAANPFPIFFKPFNLVAFRIVQYIWIILRSYSLHYQSNRFIGLVERKSIIEPIIRTLWLSGERIPNLRADLSQYFSN